MSGKSSSFNKLQKLPRQALFESHVWADYIELLCLFGVDKEITKSDFLRHYRKRKDLGEAPEYEESGADELEEEDDKEEETEELAPAETSDRAEVMVDDLFRLIAYRSGAFTDFYPFFLTKDQDVLRVRSSLSLRHRFYIFLLLSSNLSYFGQHQATLTKSFEILSAEVLKTFLADSAEVHVFGAHHGGRYAGSLWNKIGILAKDIHTIVLAKVTDFSPANSGDKGLDIVGWIPIKDPAANLLVIFGQCACSVDEWEQKQSSSAAAAWSGTIHLTTRPSNMAFIPFCLRRADGSWHKSQDIRETILIDRLRFVLLLNGKYTGLKKYFTHEGVQKMLKQEGAII